MNELSDHELREALRPRRAEPAAFRRAFDRKVAERLREPRAEPVETRAPWRSAAAGLPAGWLRPPGAAAAPGGGSGLLGSVALPAISLAMLALAFVGSLLVVLRARAGAPEERLPASEAERTWWRERAWHAAAVLLLLVLLARTEPLEALMLVLIVSMAAMASMLVRLARAGAASRRSVGSFTSHALAAVCALVLLSGQLVPADTRGRESGPWVVLVLLTGSILCGLLAAWQRERPAARNLAILLLVLLAPAAVAARLHARVRALDEERLVAHVERFDAPLADVVGWTRLGVVAEWLRASTAEASPPAGARRRLAAVRAELAPGASLLDSGAPAHALLGAARAGWIGAADRALLRDDPRVRRLLELETEAPLLESGTTEWLVRAIAGEGGDPRQRERVAVRLANAWPAAEAPRAIESMAFLEEMCALLGHPLEGEPFGSEARRALELRWTGRDFGTPLDGFPASDVLRLPPALAAVRLMRAFGVPPEIDLDGLESFLRRAATPSLVEALAPRSLRLLTVQDHRYLAEVALRRLRALRQERGVPAAEPTPARRLLDARLLLGALALAALGLLATVRASRVGGADALGR